MQNHANGRLHSKERAIGQRCMGVEGSLGEVLDMDDRCSTGFDPTDDEHARPEQGRDNLYRFCSRVGPLGDAEAELAVGKRGQPYGEDLELAIELTARRICRRRRNRWRNVVSVVSAHHRPPVVRPMEATWLLAPRRAAYLLRWATMRCRLGEGTVDSCDLQSEIATV